jgi:hypothetical protein
MRTTRCTIKFFLTLLRCSLLLVLVQESLGQPRITVGEHVLAADTPGQSIKLKVTGGTPVQGLNFNAQIGDGGPVVGGSAAGPVITATDVLTGTIFAANNTGQRDLGSLPQLTMAATTTRVGAVQAEGLLVTLTVDTTGFASGRWSLSLSNTFNGATDFAGVAAAISDGFIEVGPRLLNVEILSPGRMSFSVATTLGKKYRIEYSEQLLNPGWKPLGDVITGSGNRTLVVVDLGQAHQRFYRAVLLE